MAVVVVAIFIYFYILVSDKAAGDFPRLSLQTHQLLLGHVRDVPVISAQVQRVELRYEEMRVRQSPRIRRGRQLCGQPRQELCI